MMFFRKTLNLRIILQTGFTFIVVSVFATTTVQWKKGPPANARSRLSATYLQLLATDAPETLSAGMQFWCPYRNVEIYRYHRAQEH